MILIHDLVLTSLKHNILFRARHISGVHNTDGDYISRFQVEQFKVDGTGFQDLNGLMDHYNHSLSVNATVMVSTNCPIIGKQVAVNFVAQ